MQNNTPEKNSDLGLNSQPILDGNPNIQSDLIGNMSPSINLSDFFDANRSAIIKLGYYGEKVIFLLFENKNMTFDQLIEELFGKNSTIEGKNEIENLIGKMTNYGFVIFSNGKYSLDLSVKVIESSTDDELFQIVKSNYQGGISDDVFNTDVIRSYIKENEGHILGFLGLKAFRNNQIDEYFEKILKERGLTNEKIALFIVSKYSRSFFEDYNYHDLQTQDEELYEELQFNSTNEEKIDIIDGEIDTIVKLINEMV